MPICVRSDPGQKYIFFLIGDSPGATVPRYTVLESSCRANVTPHVTYNAVTYHFRDIHSQTYFGAPWGRICVWDPYLPLCKFHADQCHRR